MQKTTATKNIFYNEIFALIERPWNESRLNSAKGPAPAPAPTAAPVPVPARVAVLVRETRCRTAAAYPLPLPTARCCAENSQKKAHTHTHIFVYNDMQLSRVESRRIAMSVVRRPSNYNNFLCIVVCSRARHTRTQIEGTENEKRKKVK